MVYFITGFGCLKWHLVHYDHLLLSCLSNDVSVNITYIHFPISSFFPTLVLFKYSLPNSLTFMDLITCQLWKALVINMCCLLLLLQLLMTISDKNIAFDLCRISDNRLYEHITERTYSLIVGQTSLYKTSHYLTLDRQKYKWL